MSDHSVRPDIITGWQQRQLIAKLKQFPLIFMNPTVDIVSKTLTSFGNSQAYRVVYMGPRYNSNMKAFKAYSSSQLNPKLYQTFLYGSKQFNKYSFKHYHEGQKFFPIRVSQYRLFIGSNPTLKKDDLRFDSDFECGNLDLAIYVNPAQYDLVMRVDSNTKGHTAWFYFKVSNCTPNQKIKFNIINFSKRYLLYKDGMRPYVYLTSTGQWSQNCQSVSYKGRKLRYEGVQQTRYQCLSFIYEFKTSEDVYFAYCVPYSYSFLLHRLEQFKTKSPHLIKINYDSQSTGGLPIPTVTITNFSSTNEKNTILCTGRLHPGETQGSWMVDGFIQNLLSAESHYLRDKFVFKIIPMVNVDGVVLGNFRTGIMGRDLNRCFNLYEHYNEISIVHRLAQQKTPLIFLDFHGHSAKRNVFIYGPDYKVDDRNYLLCRVLPKLISKQTQAFRYYSCSFNISRSKNTTGRAIMLRSFKIQYCYTVEASSHAFGPLKGQKLFTNNEYQSVGIKIVSALTQFAKFLRILPQKEEIGKMKQEKKSEKEGWKKQKIQQEKSDSQQNYKSSLLYLQSLPQISGIQKNLLKQIMKDQAFLDEQNQQRDQDSDFEDEVNDYSNKQLDNILSNKFESTSSDVLKDTKSKSKKTKKDQFFNNKKSMQLSPKKKKRENFTKNKSQSFKTVNPEGMAISETIEVIEIQKKSHTFEQKASKMLEKRPLHLIGIVNKRGEKNKKVELNVSQDEASLKFFQRNNNVNVNWNPKKDQQRSSKHFQFEIPQYNDPIIKKSIQETEMEKSESKKKAPMLSIKRSILPVLGRSSENIREGVEKSMLSEILQQHQRKKKNQRNLKIMFL